MVFFSEKAYWYPQGYAVGELILFYAFPVTACLWAIDYFHVRRLSALVLVAALYAFIVEGVLTPVIYEAGLIDPVMPAYFIGWHGLLSVVFGWYSLRKWLVKGEWPHLMAASLLFGFFWGIWSLTYWLPENFAGFSNPGQWPIVAFGLYALTFSLMLIAGHWLLGQIQWPERLGLSRFEKWGVLAVLVFFFATLSLPFAPLGMLKLAVLLAAVFLPLFLNRQREPVGSLLGDLGGPVQLRHALILLLMPLMATTVYGFASVLPLDEEIIQTILELTPFFQSLVGAMIFAWALVATIRSLSHRSTTLARTKSSDNF